MNLLAMAIAGGFCGTATACAISFVLARAWVRTKIDEMMKAAHDSGTCPICKNPMRHDA
jgi:hypothetical protein